MQQSEDPEMASTTTTTANSPAQQPGALVASPLALTVGTEVSAKFKGAFCEAKLKKVVRSVKVKIQLKEPPNSSLTVDDTTIRGKCEVGQIAEYIQGKQPQKCQILSIKDNSTYTVVFDDGDIRVLKRNQIHLKSGRHFATDVNLDALPLYNPETFVSKMLARKKKELDEANEERDDDNKPTNSSSSSKFDVKTPPQSPTRVRRSASVTPLKGVASTRSLTRAIAALRSEDDLPPPSKSPSPTLPRSSSVTLHKALDFDDGETNTNVSEGESVEEELGIAGDNNFKVPLGSSISSKCSDTSSTITNASSVGVASKSQQQQQTKLGTQPIASANIKIEVEDADETSKPSAKNIPVDKTKVSPGTPVIINDPEKTLRIGIVVSAEEYADVRLHIMEQATASNSKERPPPLLDDPQKWVPVRSFQNGKYFLALWEHIVLFDPNTFRPQFDFTTPWVRLSYNNASNYLKNGQFPGNWPNYGGRVKKEPNASQSTNVLQHPAQKRKISPDERSSTSSTHQQKRTRENTTEQDIDEGDEIVDESSDYSSSDDDDDQERRDHFVAHYYKFQDDSGNAMNRNPVLGGREVDLYRFYKVVDGFGGHKRVTAESQWRRVLHKLNLENCPGSTPTTVKNAYLRYFEKFEAFMRQLGYAVVGAISTSSANSSRRLVGGIRAPLETRRDQPTTSSKKEKKESKEGEQSKKEKSVVKSETKSSKRESSVASDKKSQRGSSVPKTSEKKASSVSKGSVKTEPQQLVETSTSAKQHVKKRSPASSADGDRESHGKSAATISSDEKKHSVASSSSEKPKEPSAKKKPSLHKSKSAFSSSDKLKKPKEEKSKLTSHKKVHSSKKSKDEKKKKEKHSGSNSKESVEQKKEKQRNSAEKTIVTTTSPSPILKSEECKVPEGKIESTPSSFLKASDQLISSEGISSTLSTAANKQEVVEKEQQPQESSKKSKSPDSEAPKKEERISSATPPLSSQKMVEATLSSATSGPTHKARPPFIDSSKKLHKKSSSKFGGERKPKNSAAPEDDIHARHHIRFYDARVIIVEQPSLKDIAKSLSNAYELERITHRSTVTSLADLTFENMSAELKDALKTLLNSMRVFVHYLGWNSRYDEWLLLHKIRVEEKDEKTALASVEALVQSGEFPPQLYKTALDWCTKEGIPQLAAENAFVPSLDRPRRLSSASSIAGGSSAKKQHDHHHHHQKTDSKEKDSSVSSDAAGRSHSFSSHKHPLSTSSSQLIKLPSKTSEGPPDSSQTQKSVATGDIYKSPLNAFGYMYGGPVSSVSSLASSGSSSSYVAAPPLPASTLAHPTEGLQVSKPSSTTKFVIPHLSHQQQQQQKTVGIGESPLLPQVVVGSEQLPPQTSISPPKFKQSHQQTTKKLVGTGSSGFATASIDPFHQQHLVASSSSTITAPLGAASGPSLTRSPPAIHHPPSTILTYGIGETGGSKLVSSMAGGYTVAPYSIVIRQLNQQQQDVASSSQSNLLPPPPAPPTSETLRASPKLEEISKEFVFEQNVKKFGWEIADKMAFTEFRIPLELRESTEAAFSLPSPPSQQQQIAVEQQRLDSSRSPPLRTPPQPASSPQRKRVIGQQQPSGGVPLTKKARARTPPPPTLSRGDVEPSDDEEPRCGSQGQQSASQLSSSQHQDNSSLTIRQRVTQRLEAEGTFNSYAFVGLPELSDLLANVEGDRQAQIRLMEQRMQELRDIHLKYKKKLAKLERRWKWSQAKRKELEEETQRKEAESAEKGTEIAVDKDEEKALKQLVLKDNTSDGDNVAMEVELEVATN